MRISDWSSDVCSSDLEEYAVARQKGTERAFTGRYWDTTTHGIYRCVGCGTPLFASDTKFDAGCGWPSYFEPLDPARVREEHDRSEEHTSELQSLMCISYAVFCLKTTKTNKQQKLDS